MSDPAAWGLDTMSTRKPALSVFANVAGFTYGSSGIANRIYCCVPKKTLSDAKAYLRPWSEREMAVR